jgi:hypothetical protein
VFFFTARPEEAEQLLKAGMAKPLGRPGKKVRCLQLQCSRKAAHTFLRGGRTLGQASKTFRIERVGDKRLPLFQHVDERCLEFRPELKVAARDSGGKEFAAFADFSYTAPAELEDEKGVCTIDTLGGPQESATCEQLPAVDNSCAQPEIEIAVNAEGKEVAEKGGEEATSSAEPVTPRLCEGRCNEQPHPITHAETVLELEEHDISALRKLGAAVLVRAFEDAQTDSRARQWFEVTPQPMLTFWCQVVGLDVGTVRKRALGTYAGG